MSCGSKYEDRNQKGRKRRFNGSLELRTVRGRDREWERERKTTLFHKKTLTQCTCVCVQCTLLYKSFWGLTEVLSYFNALKERLHKPQNIFLTEYLSSHHSVLWAEPAYPIGPNRLGTRPDRSVHTTRSSASSADPADVELVSQQSGIEGKMLRRSNDERDWGSGSSSCLSVTAHVLYKGMESL